ncbi:phosphate ABC transporter substrate-binding protein [bacterium]
MKKLLSIITAGLMLFQLGYAMDEITMEGSTTVLSIAQIAAEVYMDNNADVDISVRGGGSGVGIASLLEGTCDIADASRPIKDKELNKAVEKGINPVAHVVAMDALCIVVHSSNPIKNLTKQQIKDIYTGKISYWDEVGGPEKEIVIVSRDTASGTYETFMKLVLDKQKTRPDSLLEASNKAVATVVSHTPGGIGYIGLGYLNSSVKALTANGVKCTKENALSGKYPFSRLLFMYTNGEPKGAVKDFMDFIKGIDGQKLVEEVGYIGLE